MPRDYRKLAWRHMWLSWWWGLGLVGLAGLVAVGMATNGVAGPALRREAPLWLLMLGLLAFPGPLLFLGPPALLGALLRWPLMRWVLRTGAAPGGVALWAALMFEASVLVCWLLWEAYNWLARPYVFHGLLKRHWQNDAFIFFALSLPWLLSSVVAAWWVTRRMLQATTSADYES